MSFALASPLALGLAILVAGPILAHLIRRTPSRRHAFGAMLLLRRLPKRARRRRRLSDKVLFALRALTVLAVVGAIAGPTLEWPGAVVELGGSGAVVLVVDDSLSMALQDDAGGTLLSRARAEAVALVRGLPENTLVAAVRLGGTAARITPALSLDHALVIAALQNIEQSSLGTDLVGGIRIGRQLLAGEGGELVVFSDEAGEGIIEAATSEIALLTAQGGGLVPRPIHAKHPLNVAVIGASYGSGPEGGSVEVSVHNYGDEPVEVPVGLSLPDGTEISGFIALAPNETVEKLFTIPRVAMGGVGSVKIDDGHLPQDDVGSFHLPTVGASRVLVIDGDPGLTPTASEVYYLERALAPWGRSVSLDGGVLPDITSPSGVEALDPEVHRLVFMANVADPGPWANRLISFVNQGGNLVLSMGDNVSVERTNAVLAKLLPARLRRPRSLGGSENDGEAAALPDVSHPLFSPFARGGLAGFSRLRFARLMTLEPFQESADVDILMKTQGGLPLLVERKVGAGRVLLFTSTLDVDWGTLPLAAVYMPLIQSMAAQLGVVGGGGARRLEGRVGEVVALTIKAISETLVVTGPQGVVDSTVDGGIFRFVPTHAGVHHIASEGLPVVAQVAVSINPQESDVRRYTSLAVTAADVDPERFMVRVALDRYGFWLALILGLGATVLSRQRGMIEEVADVA
jgi:hypothetical protein